MHAPMADVYRIWKNWLKNLKHIYLLYTFSVKYFNNIFSWWKMNIELSVKYFCLAGDCNWVLKNSSNGQSWYKADLNYVYWYKPSYLGVLTWKYAALQAAVLVLFKKTISSLSLSQVWFATLDKVANSLHLKQGKFRYVCWKYGKKKFSTK